MNTNRNSGTKKITEATASMNPLSLEGGAGGRLHLGNRGNNPNNNTENENKKATPAATSSPTGKDDDASSPSPVSSMRSNTTAPNLLTPTAAMSNLFLSSSSSSSSPPVTSSSTTTGIVMENGPCQSNKNKEVAAPSSSRTTLSGVVETERAAAETSSKVTTPRYTREECPICFHVLPQQIDQIEYKLCCGRTICLGCIVGRERAELKETGKIIEGVTSEEKQFILICLFWSNVCPFCRHPGPENDEEQLQLLYDRIQKRNARDYTTALITLGTEYYKGSLGLSINYEKAEELYQEAYDLDDPIAALKLSSLHFWRYPDQKEKWMKFYRRGETLGNVQCMEFLVKFGVGLNIIEPENYKEVTRLVTKAASLGGDTENLMNCYRKKMLSKEDLATTLRAHQAANDETKTVRREFAKRYKAFNALFEERN